MAEDELPKGFNSWSPFVTIIVAVASGSIAWLFYSVSEADHRSDIALAAHQNCMKQLEEVQKRVDYIDLHGSRQLELVDQKLAVVTANQQRVMTQLDTVRDALQRHEEETQRWDGKPPDRKK